MTSVELPRPLEAYFSFAELPATERGRNFTITFTYMDGVKVDRLQWWWQVHRAQERSGGEEMLPRLRSEAITRFRHHIERWLFNSQHCLRGGEPFPLLMSQPQSQAVPANDSPVEVSGETLRTCARIAAGG